MTTLDERPAPQCLNDGSAFITVDADDYANINAALPVTTRDRQERWQWIYET